MDRVWVKIQEEPLKDIVSMAANWTIDDRRICWPRPHMSYPSDPPYQGEDASAMTAIIVAVIAMPVLLASTGSSHEEIGFCTYSPCNTALGHNFESETMVAFCIFLQTQLGGTQWHQPTLYR